MKPTNPSLRSQDPSYSLDRLKDAPNLNLLRASHDVYEAASAIFYKHNIFTSITDMTMKQSFGTSARFVAERPHALGYMRHLRLLIGDRRREALANVFRSNDWERLYAMVSQMSLRTLLLRVTGHIETDGPFDWANHLLEIKSLREIRVNMST